MLLTSNTFAPTVAKGGGNTNSKPNLNIYGFKPNEVPYYSDLVYQERFKMLNQKLHFPLQYNKYVKAYIDVYTKTRRPHIQEIMGRSDVYFPIFERVLKKYGIPKELKYLAVIESALKANAVSSSGAVGLWQFMPASGMEQGLVINSKVDERKHPYKSTIAAAKYLKRLYLLFGDWSLAIAAYNCGQGTVLRAMQRTGKKDFWSLRPHLPAQTRSYVPAFMASLYAMNYSAEHNLFARVKVRS
jgi:membrane-bound lytic murein transglycosylase D